MPEVKIFERADGTISGTRKIIHGGVGVATAPNSFDELKTWVLTNPIIKTASGSNPLTIARGTSLDSELVECYVDDREAIFRYIEDSDVEGQFGDYVFILAGNNGEPDVEALRISDVGIFVNSNRALTTADTGSGNGLDADKLDDRHGAGYLKFKGTYNSYAALIADTDGVTGETAIVNEGVGSDAVVYVWDSSDSGWVELGTGSTNVEEGTWTPVANNVSTPFSCDLILGEYTKVGNLVTVTCAIERLTGSDTAISPSEFIITGLPYAADATFGGGGVVHEYSGISGNILPIATVVGNTMEIVRQNAETTSETAVWGGGNEIADNAVFTIVASYRI